VWRTLCPEQLRRVRFNDPLTGKTLVFLTNNFALAPLTIATLLCVFQVINDQDETTDLSKYVKLFKK